jgi:ribosome-binding ATPase YchF (GTP1/OBG family)
MSFYTAGPTHVSSWHCEKGSKAPQAAGKIHGNFEKNFILAEICSVDEWVQYPDEKTLRDKSILRKCGKEHVMEDDSVVYIKHSSR